jgi:hypothetical protein
MVNEGNIIDMAAWLLRLEESESTPGLEKWKALATIVLSIYQDTSFHYFRCKILQPFQ